MNMFKKLVLTALLVPSSLVIASEPPVQPESLAPLIADSCKDTVKEVIAQADTIGDNLYNSVAGFKEGIYKSSLGTSRYILALSKIADKMGNHFAEHYWQLAALHTAIVCGGLYWYFKRPSRPSWMSMQPVYRLVQRGKARFMRPQPQPDQEVVEVVVD